MIKHNSTRRSSLLLKKTDGYIVIIVLLLTSVLLMLGLSLATRTTEEVYQSGQEADTTRVFNAAETGIEGALYSIQTGFTVPNSGATPIPVTVTGGDASLNVTGERASDFDVSVPQGEVLTLAWKDGTVINWDYVGACTGPALIITLYRDIASPDAHHFAVNPMSNISTQCGSRGSNFSNSTFVSPTSSQETINATDFGLTVEEIPTTSLLRIRPLYATGNFSIENSSAIKIISTAADTTGGGTSAETRKIQVIRTEPAAPSVFDYAVFSGGALTK